MTCLLSRLQANAQILLVNMNEVRFAAFKQIPAIGTKDLGSCSVIIVASKLGAILAHISPLPHPTASSSAGDNHVRSKMAEVQRLVALHQTHGYFPQKDNLIVCAVYQGAIALPIQVEIMKEVLTAIAPPPNIRTYTVPGNDQNPARGTVVVVSNDNQKPIIYIEDMRHNCIFTLPKVSLGIFY